jgi:hypothetical protein
VSDARVSTLVSRVSVMCWCTDKSHRNPGRSDLLSTRDKQNQARKMPVKKPGTLVDGGNAHLR